MNSSDSFSNPSHIPKLVTIGVPIYKRLEYLPNVLKMASAQEYPEVELIISDNGQNGTKVQEIIESAGYSRPCRVRQNPATVNISEHFNQIINEASGEYYLTLNDDDEISPDYVSELMRLLEKHREATVGLSRQETIDVNGAVIGRSKQDLPPVLSGPDFIRAVWKTREFGFRNVESFLTRTKLLRETGGYPEFANGNYSDDTAVIRCCLNNYVVLSSKCVYRHRVHEGGFGWKASMEDLAAATRDFIQLLDEDPTIRRFANKDRQEWRNLRRCLVEMSWLTYLWRWRDIYRDRLSTIQWIKAAFALPWLPRYLWQVAMAFRATTRAKIKTLLTGQSEKREDFFRRDAKCDGASGGTK
jgi:glycosyltransferase involved in cell wall biosynthesis